MKQLAEARLTEEQMLGARNNVVADYEDFVCGIPMGAESATDEQARTLHTYERLLFCLLSNGACVVPDCVFANAYLTRLSFLIRVKMPMKV